MKYTMYPIFVVANLVLLCSTSSAYAQEKDALPALDEVIEGYEKVLPADGKSKALYAFYINKETCDVLAHLPEDYEEQMIYLTHGIAQGWSTAGTQYGHEYSFGSWKRRGNRMAFVMPQLEYVAEKAPESSRSKEVLYTKRHYFDVPIVAQGPDGAPVINLSELFVHNSTIFERFIPGQLVSEMATIKSVKSFAENATLYFEFPYRSRGNLDDGTLITLGFSLGLLPSDPDYKPRNADYRVGYFHTAYTDLEKRTKRSTLRRYIHRWSLEKVDPELALSPPKKPIVFYIDHKTPIKYRRWVRDGILEWNKAFEQVGIVNAIEVRQQDVRTGAHMDKDPQDIQHNFIVWNSSGFGFAMGPSRVDPRTGQIIAADIIFHDGWIRVLAIEYRRYLANAFTHGLDGDTLNWLSRNPSWDPRVRFGTAIAVNLDVDHDHHFGHQGYHGQQLQSTNHSASGCTCSQAGFRALSVAMARYGLLHPKLEDDDSEIEAKMDEMIGRQVKDVIMHEFGHILGLRHNYKGSAAFTLEQINSDEWRNDKKPISGSVMDYNAPNYRAAEAEAPDNLFMQTLGPYDYWAIQFGYGPEEGLPDVLKAATETEHSYLTDEDLYGPDPATLTWDLGQRPLEFVDAQMDFIKNRRAMLLDRALVEGESFEEIRYAYMALLGLQSQATSISARTIGALHVHRDRVGDSDRNPTVAIPADVQRGALQRIVQIAFQDSAYDLTPELLAKMSQDKWFDGQFVPQNLPDPQLNTHDIVLDIQSSTLTLLLNPTKLGRVYDNELRMSPEEDAFTLAELLDGIQQGIWEETSQPVDQQFTLRQPFVSSLRRNLQREHVDRLIELVISKDALMGAATHPVASLAANHMRLLKKQLDEVLATEEGRLDDYSRSHFKDISSRIDGALQAKYTFGAQQTTGNSP